ncbi:MAG: pyridoxal-dependent decarboxylase [Gammaproteobacteria bacterium]
MSGTPSAPAAFDAAEFRREALLFLDWIIEYLARVEEFPVRSRATPGALRAALPAAAPARPEPPEAILADLQRLVVPGLTHWQSPNFFAYFPANSSWPAVLGELVSAALGVQGMLWITSPACTELETHVLDWLADLCGLPPAFRSSARGGGVLQDSASSAVLCALLAARERASGGRTNEEGCRGDLVVYGSTQAHSSLDKAVRVAGLGQRQLRKIPVDGEFALRPDALAAQIAADRAAGLTPCMVCVTLGTTSTLAFDPLPEVGAICRREGLWLHVDAALAGSAAVCPEYRPLLAGLEAADSYCFNPHKWLLTNFDCSCLYVADREQLVSALSITPEYLRNPATEAGDVIDYRDWQIPLGRRFRALKLWFVLRRYGVEGLQAHIRRHVGLTARFAERIADDPRFDVVAPTRLNLHCFRCRGSDALNRALLESLNDSGEVFLSHTTLDGRYVLRFCVGQPRTGSGHVERAAALVVTTLDRLLAGGLQ